MTYAELLRKYATDATNEGGMWFSGEYMTVLASIAESIEAENAKLRDELANAPKCEECEAMLDCDECLRADGSHKERRRLSVENAKLQASNEVIAEDHAVLCEQNAKLRKLVQRMWRLERFGCYGCRQECDAESCYANECKEAIEIEQEMRELGIEVSEYD